MITRFWLGTRREGRTRAAFSAHWHGVHARYGLALPGLRAYVQNHRLPTTAGTTAPTFDGCSELDFDDLDAMQAAFASPALAAADDDERRFADPDRFGVVVAERQVLLGAETVDTPARLLCFIRRLPGRSRLELIEVVGASTLEQARAVGATRAEILTALDQAPEPQAAEVVVSLWFPTVAALTVGVPRWAVASGEALAGVAFGREIGLVHPRRLR